MASPILSGFCPHVLPGISCVVLVNFGLCPNEILSFFTAFGCVLPAFDVRPIVLGNRLSMCNARICPERCVLWLLSAVPREVRWLCSRLAIYLPVIGCS